MEAQSAGKVYSVASLAQWQSATASARAGDTIQLQPSVNGLNLTLEWKWPPNWPSSGTCQVKPEYCLTITGVPNKMTIFTSGGLTIRRPNVVVRNLKFRQNPLNSVPIKIENEIGYRLSNVRLTDLIFEDLGPAAMDTSLVRYAIYAGARPFAGEPYPVKDVRIDSSYFNRINYTIIIRINTFIQNVRIDHNFFSNAVSCPANGCDAIHLGGTPPGDVDPQMNALVDHNKFIRMKGESELISSKTWGNKFINNFIFEPHGAISFRTGKGAVARRNVIIKPDINPLRPVGVNHILEQNVLVLHKNAPPAILFYGTDVLYPGHMEGSKCVANPVGHGTGAYEPVKSLILRNNWYASKTPLPSFATRSDLICGCDPQSQQAILCNVSPNIRVQAGNENVSFDLPEVLKLVNSSDDFCAVFRPDPAKPTSSWNGYFSIIDCKSLVYTSVNGRSVVEDYVNLGKTHRMFP